MKAITTIEPCLAEAKALVRQVSNQRQNGRHRRLINAFTALAGADLATGLLAYYIWRKRRRGLAYGERATRPEVGIKGLGIATAGDS